MSTGSVRISTRLEFVTLDELESGFCDRISDGALFLSRALLGAAPDELYVGAPVHVDIETAQGQRALSVDGVVAWAYPAHPHTPPGREAGAGILIDRHSDDDSKVRAARMLRRPGAGGRVRAPGSRLPAPRVGPARPTTGRFVPPPTTLPPLPMPAAEPPPLPPTLLAPPEAAEAAEAVDALPDVTPPAQPAVHIDEATGELVVPLPPAPQPRLMAMGMFVDQTYDFTPTPGPAPSTNAPPPAPPPPAPPPEPQRLPALPFAGLLANLEPPAGVAAEPAPPPPGVDVVPPAAQDEPTIDAAPRPISLEALPDAPPAPAAFEQRQTDVDLLMSLDDGDFFPAELEEQRARAKQAAQAAPAPAVNPALVEETVTSWSQLDDLPSADGEAELIGDDDVESLDDAPEPPILARPAARLPAPDDGDAGDDSTGSHDVGDPSSLPSIDSADLRTAEHTAVVAASSLPAQHAEEHTREGDVHTERGAAVRSTAASADAPTSEADAPPTPRPLPELPPFPPPDEPGPGPIGVAFLFSMRRGPEFLHAVEAFAWPKSGTKRWNALDAAREEGNEDAMDAAVASSAWLARDPSVGAFEAGGHTDPGIRVSDVVDKAVAMAAEDDDGDVFSDSPAQVRPAMQRGRAGEGPGETTVDETFARRDETNETTADPADSPDLIDSITSRDTVAPVASVSDDDVETDRDLKRPPTKASAAAQARLGVLQRFLGRR